MGASPALARSIRVKHRVVLRREGSGNREDGGVRDGGVEVRDQADERCDEGNQTRRSNEATQINRARTARSELPIYRSAPRYTIQRLKDCTSLVRMFARPVGCVPSDSASLSQKKSTQTAPRSIVLQDYLLLAGLV